jgi:hypothetical protein
MNKTKKNGQFVKAGLNKTKYIIHLPAISCAIASFLAPVSFFTIPRRKGRTHGQADGMYGVAAPQPEKYQKIKSLHPPGVSCPE